MPPGTVCELLTGALFAPLIVDRLDTEGVMSLAGPLAIDCVPVAAAEPLTRCLPPAGCDNLPDATVDLLSMIAAELLLDKSTGCWLADDVVDCGC